MSDLRCIQIHYQAANFKIYTDKDMESLEPKFYEWVEKTKVYTGSSLCRFIRKKQPKIRALSENQYLNFLMSRKPYKKYF